MDDRSLLNEAVRQRRYWDVVYYSRRLMGVDPHDQHSFTALFSIPGHQFTYLDSIAGIAKVNPLFGSMEAESRFDLIRSSRLIERDQGAILFRLGDPGDTMFVILRGEVAVSFEADPDAFAAGEAPPIRLGVGDIVGELAFALHRKRTATLRCLTRTALLSFSPQAVEWVASRSPSGAAIRDGLDQFVKARILEHLCNNLPYLIGRARLGPLRAASEPWLWLADYTALLDYRSANRRISPTERDMQRPGLFILVSGELRDAAAPERILDGTKLPIVYADLPGIAPCRSRFYEVTRDAVIVRIAAEAFADPLMPPNALPDLLQTVGAALPAQQRG